MYNHKVKIFNSYSQIKEEFKPLEGKLVRMYVCGVTPYDTTHLGHAATYLFFDVVKRYLEYKDFDVNYVQNITDVDDSILEKARQVNKNWKNLGNFWTEQFLSDLSALNILMPTHFVKATGSIPKIIEIIEILLKKGMAYQKNGNVYFEVAKFKNYGQLSKLKREEMIALSKERGANPDDPNKKDPLDFILWQKSLLDEPFWDSPWGKGRPGWHIECSAMIYQYLGDQIDIHGGGADLIYPHHDSEIAQSESFTGKSQFVGYWMHIGMVYYRGEKMSKSLGNLILVKDLLKKYSPNAIRWMLLSHYYRTPWEFNGMELKASGYKLDSIFKKIESENSSIEPEKAFLDTLDDDFNIPKALEVIENSQNPSAMLKILGFQLHT